jgi:hypothetical protein
MNGGNGDADAASLDREIGRLRREIAATEGAAQPLADRLAALEVELEGCRQHFLKHGFAVVGVVPAERDHYRWVTTRGALMAAAGDKLLELERARLTARFNADRRLSMTPIEQSSRLAELRPRLRLLLAQRELHWRSLEDAGQAPDRQDVDPETYLMLREDLAAAAAGGEAA